MPQKLKFPANIGTAVRTAIRQLGETQGSSFVDIKKHLLSKYQGCEDMPDSAVIKESVKKAVDTGALLKLDNGKYIVKEAARRRRSRSRSRSRGAPRRRSKSRKRSGGRRRSRSSSRKRRRSSSGKRRSRSTSRRRRRRHVKPAAAEE